jgi:hypothetical protein
MRGFRLTLVLALCPSALAAQQTISPAVQDILQPQPARHSSFWQAAGGVLAANGVTWGYNWYVQRWHWANVGTQSWVTNLRDGFVWDDDCFVDNQLAHPFHGSFYLGSARAGGYGFWGSVPFVAAGSASWELFFENVRPSLNDLINTTLGGLALGEVTFRLSSLLLSGTGTTGGRLVRQAGAFALSPLARTQQLLLHAPGAVELDQLPPAHRTWIAAGTFRNHIDPLLSNRADRAFLEVGMDYGDPFSQRTIRPYDAFEVRVEVSRGETELLNHLEISGLLARTSVRGSERGRLALGVFQHYDYHDSEVLTFGGQSLSGALLYQRALGGRTHVRLAAHAEGLLLGAISSEYGHYFRRDYDYGPGAGGRIAGSLRYQGRDVIRVEQRVLFLHSLHGAEADHVVSTLRLGSTLPLGHQVELGGDIQLTRRHSTYRSTAASHSSTSRLRAFVAWSPQ